MRRTPSYTRAAMLQISRRSDSAADQHALIQLRAIAIAASDWEPDLIALERSQFAFLGCLRRVVIVPRSQTVPLLDVRCGVLNSRPAVVGCIFLAVDRCHMRWISIEIRSPDSKLVAVR